MAQLPSSCRGPGLVDLQVNGYAGVDFNAPPETWRAPAFHRVREALARRGVQVALPTLITDAPERMVARARRYAALIKEERKLALAFPRLHIEGPFISAEDGPRGAHPQAHCRTPHELPDLLPRLREASGDRVGIVTMAPELPGAIDLIRQICEEGICVALGHTQAQAQTVRAAIEAGATLSTHLGNGSHQTLPRLANYVQAQLAEDQLSASFIADGHHLPFYTLKNFIRAKTPQRSILITDAIAAAEQGPGRYTLGGEEVVVTSELRASRPGQPNLAGSALTLDRAIINVATQCDVSFSEAWAMASTRPAALVGIEAPQQIAVNVSSEGFTKTV